MGDSQRRSRSVPLNGDGETGLKRGHIVGDKAGSRIQITVPGTFLFIVIIHCSAQLLSV